MARTRFIPLAALAAAGLLLTACTSGSPSGEPDGGNGNGNGETALTDITVGVLTIAPSAAVKYGIDNGIFEEHGLNVTTQEAQGGAAMLPSVSTGEYDFGVGNPLSVLTAASNGIDVRITGGYSFSLEDGDDINAVVALADSGLETWSDLEGHSVSVNAVNTQGDLTIMDSVRADGGDPDAVDFVEVGFGDALAQLDNRNVDAVWIPEPFLSAALEDPDQYTVIGYPNQEALPGLPTLVTFASGAVVEDAELLEQWRAAIVDVLEQVNADPEGFATTIAEFTGMPEAAALDLRLERLSGELDREIIVDLSDLALDLGFITNEPDLDTVIVP